MSIFLTPLDCVPDSHLKTVLGLSPAIFVHRSAKTPITLSADCSYKDTLVSAY